MGGNLFKLGRLPRDAYLEIERELRGYLDQKLGARYRIPRYYTSKPDFGDVDIVVSQAAIDTDWTQLRQEIADDLGVTQTRSTGAVFSTVYRDFQVDYFVRPERYFLSTYNFLCFNDLGNLIGKIFRRMNLKYGERGLQYVFRREGGNYKREIDVSLEMSRILAFLELDAAKWEAGFDTLDEMYRWTVASPMFSVAPYVDPGRTTRRRAKVRPTIQRFLAWIEENEVTKRCEYLADRDGYLPRIAAAFPEAGLLEAIAVERAREARAAVVRSKFSGELVMSWRPELSGRALGEFIRTFRAGLDDFEARVAEMDADEVRRRVMAHEVPPS